MAGWEKLEVKLICGIKYGMVVFQTRTVSPETFVPVWQIKICRVPDMPWIVSLWLYNLPVLKSVTYTCSGRSANEGKQLIKMGMKFLKSKSSHLKSKPPNIGYNAWRSIGQACKPNMFLMYGHDSCKRKRWKLLLYIALYLRDYQVWTPALDVTTPQQASCKSNISCHFGSVNRCSV